MSTDTLRLEVVTPAGLAVEAPNVTGVVAPGHLGEFEARPGHQPYLVRLRPGRLSHSNGKATFAISGGIAEVRADHVIVLADACEALADIDIARAQSAGQRAKDRLAGEGPKDENTDLDRAQVALTRALVRVGLASS